MKRQDLQGLRGIAVSAVLLFHFFPYYFPNGYLGVDMFFVLSGFLMSLVLYDKPSNVMTIKDFYYRRLKRIFPLYFLITWLVLLFILLVFPTSFLIVNRSTFAKSVLFVSNTAQSNSLNYYMQLNRAENLYTHTWSLSVEIQYYLMVPLIFTSLTMIGKRKTIPCLCVIGMLSILFHWFSGSSTSFYNVFARIWQFSTGSIVYYISHEMDKSKHHDQEKSCLLPSKNISDKSEELSEKKKASYISLFVFILLVISLLGWNSSCSTYMRSTTTTMCGMLILLGSSNRSTFLTNSVIVQLGDISYSLYLLHWPIVVYIKTFYNEEYTAKFAGLFAAILLSLLLENFFEKWYLKLSGVNIAILISALLTLNAITYIQINLQLNNINMLSTFPLNTVSTATTKSSASKGTVSSSFNSRRTDPPPDIMLATEALRLNRYYISAEPQLNFNDKCKYVDPTSPFGFCNMTGGLNPASKNTGSIIGNSYAANLGNLVLDNCGMKLNRLTQNSQVVCEPLAKTEYVDMDCGKVFQEFYDNVRNDAPDYLFIISRWINLAKRYNSSSEANTLFEIADKRMSEFEAVVRKKILVLHGFPTPKSGFLQVFNNRIEKDKLNAKSDDLIDPIFERNNSRSRLEELARKHSKMILIDIEQGFTYNGKYHLTDEETAISYFTGSLHVSPHGEKRLGDIFKKACDILE